MAKKDPSAADAVVVTNEEKGATVLLGAVLDIRSAAPLRDGLLNAIRLGKPVLVDARQVERMSTPCVQVLLAAGRSAEASNGRIVLTQASDNFVAAFSDLGLFGSLMSWQAEQ